MRGFNNFTWPDLLSNQEKNRLLLEFKRSLSEKINQNVNNGANDHSFSRNSVSGGRGKKGHIQTISY